MGSMIPQVQWANSNGIPILIMNPNFIEGSPDQNFNLEEKN
jgi:hypothetical protein